MKKIDIYIRTEEDGFVQVIENAQEYDLINKPLARSAFIEQILHGFNLVEEKP
jgi:hypothetical protein